MRTKKNLSHKQKSLSERSRAATVLKEIANDLDPFLTFCFAPKTVARYGIEGARRIRQAAEHRRRRQELERLARRKLIKMTKTADAYTVSLTDEGKIQVFRLRVLDADLLPEGTVCMVVFDIPEQKKSLRQMLRRFLSEAGFLPIQKSVWISPFDAGKQLSTLFQATKASGWIRIFTSIESK